MANSGLSLAMRTLGAALCFATSALAYVNVRFGVSVDVPADWRAEAPSANGDGRGFVSPDGAARLLVYGGFQVEGSPAQTVDKRRNRAKEKRSCT